MPTVTTPNGVEAALNFKLAGQDVVNVLDFRATAPITPAYMSALGSGLVDWWNAFKGYFSNEIELVSVTVTDLTSTSGAVIVTTPSSPIPGGHAQPSLPGNCAVVVTKRTAQRGRSYRGRVYTSGVPRDANTSPDSVSSTYATNMLSALAGLLGNTYVQNAVWSVLSYFLNKAARANGVLTDITALSVDTSIDSSRRRLLGRGT